MVAVAPGDPRWTQGAESLARRLHLPLVDQLEAAPSALCLLWTGQRLELCSRDLPNTPGIWVDLVGGAAGHRRRFGGGRGQALARAVGLKRGICPRVLDATAGLARDAFVLATLGCHVDLVERSPVIAALVDDGLRRAQLDPDTAPICARMRLIVADARLHMVAAPLTGRPEVIYVDPMFPPRTKRARVKKEMQILQSLVGETVDAVDILEIALTVATRRVVVKRPAGAPALAGHPTHHIDGKTTRFDVYLPKRTASGRAGDATAVDPATQPDP